MYTEKEKRVVSLDTSREGGLIKQSMQHGYHNLFRVLDGAARAEKVLVTKGWNRVSVEFIINHQKGKGTYRHLHASQ